MSSVTDGWLSSSQCVCVCVTGGASVPQQRAHLVHLCFLWLSDSGRRAGANWSSTHEEGLCWFQSSLLAFVKTVLNSRYITEGKSRCRKPNASTTLTLILANTDFAWCNVTVVSEGTSVKFVTNNHCVSGNCWKGFQGQRSKVKGHIKAVCTLPTERQLSAYFIRLLTSISLMRCLCISKTLAYKYSSCKWPLLKKFSGSHVEVMAKPNSLVVKVYISAVWHSYLYCIILY